MRKWKVLLVVSLSFLFVGEAFARPGLFGRLRARRGNYTYNNTQYSYSNQSSAAVGGEDVQAAAYNRAASLAAKGYGHHFSLPCNGASCEGWGMGPTPEAALNNCCRFNSPILGQAAVWSERAQTYFAIRLYR